MSNVRLSEICWKDVEEYLKEQDVVTIPLGSTEQQGPHLPLSTDSLIVEHLCEEAARQTGTLVAPGIRFGVSGNHMDFPGTLALQPETLIALVCDVCRSLSHHGFRKILLVNGHGVNSSTLDVAILKLKTAIPRTIVGQAYPGHLCPEGQAVLEDDLVSHADESETSRMLAISPELVRMERALAETPVSPSGLVPFQNAEILSTSFSYGFPKTKAVTASGIFGNAALGTPEKGNVLLELEVKRLADEIRRLQAIDPEGYSEGWTSF